MVNLSTVYGVSIVLGSLAAIGSAFVGTKVYPIQTGGDPLTGPALLGATITGAFKAAEKALEPSPKPLATETVKEDAPVVEAPPVEAPSVEAPPVEAPPVEETPVEAPPVEAPPVSGGKRRVPAWFTH
jgi:hypothetical protein